ncbi:MAG: hypothetical protein JST87_10120 [Bacteroidetes bacterium]|nr:hypothetical protein [Bacteroidota bacterium]
MKRNFKILVYLLLPVVIILNLIKWLFIEDTDAKSILSYLSAGLLAAIFLSFILFLLKPQWFKGKSKNLG